MPLSASAYASGRDVGDLFVKSSSSPWFVVGPPWNEGAPWINAESEDPQGGHFVCDLAWPHDTPEDVERTEANAELIVRACNEYEALLAIERAVRRQDGVTGMLLSQETADALAWLDEVRRG